MNELLFFRGVLIGSLGLIILLVALFIMFIKHEREKIKAFEEKVNRELQFQKELRTAEFEVSEEIRSQISRELHDNIGHTLALARLIFEQVRKKKEFNPKKLEELDHLIEVASTDLRSVSRSLNSDFLALNDFSYSIEMELNRLKKFHPANIEFIKGCINESTLSKEQRLFAYRIFQESMSNAIKHSKAERITVHCLTEDFVLKIEDNGMGFEIENSTNVAGFNGIMNMHKRAELVDLKINLTSTLRLGTTLQLSLS
jgi:two-component system NarL family sensor kinase